MANSSSRLNELDLLEFTGSETVLDIHYGKSEIAGVLNDCLPQGKRISWDCSYEDYHLEEKVAVATSFHSLERIQDLNGFFDQVSCMLQPGGKWLIVAIAKESEELQVLREALSEEEIFLKTPYFSIEDYRTALSLFGFEIVHMEVTRSIAVYETQEELEGIAQKLADSLCLQNLSLEFAKRFGAYAYERYFNPHSEAVLLPSKKVLLLVVKKTP